jgi:hypothetical protein
MTVQRFARYFLLGTDAISSPSQNPGFRIESVAFDLPINMPQLTQFHEPLKFRKFHTAAFLRSQTHMMGESHRAMV